MRLFKRHISILLVGILFLQADGVLVIYRLQQCMIHYKVRRGIRQNEFSTEELTLSVTEYNKSKVRSNEISFGGKMYDVKSAYITCDSVRLEVMHDKKEEHLLSKIKNFFASSKQSNSKLPYAVQKLLALKYIPPVLETLLEPLYHTVINYAVASTILMAKSLDIPSPPPR